MRSAPSTSRPTVSASPAAPPPEAVAMPASPWHSPVPYLFGGLAAMLGLIALALLILACSYWKLNNYLGTGDASSPGPGAGNNNDGSKSPATTAAASPAAFADLVAVVMAGEKTPTFLAAPIVRRTAGDTSAAAAEGSPEKDGEENGGKAGEGESGAITDAERDRQLDHV